MRWPRRRILSGRSKFIHRARTSRQSSTLTRPRGKLAGRLTMPCDRTWVAAISKYRDREARIKARNSPRRTACPTLSPSAPPPGMAPSRLSKSPTPSSRDRLRSQSGTRCRPFRPKSQTRLTPRGTRVPSARSSPHRSAKAQLASALTLSAPPSNRRTLTRRSLRGTMMKSSGSESK